MNFILKIKALTLIIIINIFTFAYSVIRYNIVGQVPLTDIPIFILNKSIAFSLIIILFLTFYYQNSQLSNNLKFARKSFIFLTLTHFLLSLSILSQDYYPKLFVDFKFNFIGNMTILFGVVAAVYIVVHRFKLNNMIFLSLLSGHLFFLGYKGWFNPAKWNGFMPPITLLCFILLIILILVSFSGKVRNRL